MFAGICKFFRTGRAIDSLGKEIRKITFEEAERYNGMCERISKLEKKDKASTIRMKGPLWKKGDMVADSMISLVRGYSYTPPKNITKVPAKEALALIIDHLDLRYQAKQEIKKPAKIVKAKKTRGKE